MMLFALFLLKSTLVLALILLLVRLNWFSAAERHFLLALAILSLPVMAATSLLPDELITVEAPQIVVDWELELGPAAVAAAPAALPAVEQPLDYRRLGILAYASIALALLAFWAVRLYSTGRLIGRTRSLAQTESGVRVRQSDRIDTPMAWGAFQPEVVVPPAWDDWPASKRRQVLAHELAHVRRRDTLTTLVGGVICALFWFQPLLWLAQRRLVIEAERAADDAVLSGGADPAAYAGLLVDIARDSLQRHAALAMAARPTLPARIRALLELERRRASLSHSQLLLGGLLALTLVVPLGTINASSTPEDGFSLLSAEGELAPTVKVAPVYPAAARRDKLEGYVLVEFTVAATGRVEDARVIEAEPAGVFDQAALDAVAKFRYKPRVEDGQAVASPGIRNRVTFALPDENGKEASAAGVVPVLGSALMERLQDVQDLISGKQYEAAMAAMNELLADTSGYSGNELGQLHNMRAYVHFLVDDYPSAISDYEQVIAARGDIPEGLYTTTLYSLAQLSFVVEDYQSALRFMARWLEVAEQPGPEPHIFSGQVYYQLQDYPSAIEHMERGIALAEAQDRTVKENWWALLNYLYFEEQQYGEAVRVLEILQREYPNEKYDQQLDSVRRALADEGAAAG